MSVPLGVFLAKQGLSLYLETVLHWRGGAYTHTKPQGPSSPLTRESLAAVRIIGSVKRGRAEVFYNGVWGTICDDGWDNSDATVFCRMLGYSVGKALFSMIPGSGSIWLDDVACQGTETSLWNCNKSNWGSHNCNHNEDAGVECS
ncbi:Macrophage receptor MARCO [Myotis davidii]|uniref:Macrophage receptor MARCO n=1 Tax=Myotis davidii TaxID=225400 RepID=L5LHL7_MYODS|nr:Macrophage receptor MARCO [Myotis davidii]